jgi:hypothetical protein
LNPGVAIHIPCRIDLLHTHWFQSPIDSARHHLTTMPLSILTTLANKAKFPSRRKSPARPSSPQRINPPPREDIEYADPIWHRLLPKPKGDGLWKCCNGHEAELIHYTGRHPFKHLTCHRFKHILCGECCTTHVIKPLHTNRNKATGPISTPKSTTHSLVPFGQVCPECGLSHRAQVVGDALDFDSLLCACGGMYDSTWLRFHIGSIDEYRRNPHASFAQLSCLRGERSVSMDQSSRLEYWCYTFGDTLSDLGELRPMNPD